MKIHLKIRRRLVVFDCLARRLAPLRAVLPALIFSTGAFAASPANAPAPEWPPDASRQTFHMIGNGHIDPVWLWPWQEGVSLVHATFRSALDRMNETPDFTFTASSALFYEWVAQNDPSMLAEIRLRIAEGRWAPVGGWWVEPDLNIPSGEALVRQGLYGQRSFERLLGRRAVTGFNPDGFGHPGTLPQILRQQGIENYVFMRPNPAEKKLPASTFWWQSPDGSRVLAYRIPISYGDKGGELRERVQKILELPAEPLPLRMAFYGVGDHGGGSTKASIASILAMQSGKNAPRLTFGTPDAFFEKVRELMQNAGTGTQVPLPFVNDELQHHAVGCYSAHSEIKKLNRKTELALLTAEKITSIGSVVWDNACPKHEFATAWKRVLFQQFHDSLAGTSLPEHDAYARAAYGSAQAEAVEATWLALQKLEWQVPATDADSDYYIVFNPHAWPAALIVEQEFKFKKFPDTLEDETGKKIPFQMIVPTTESDRLRQRFLARVELPVFGYRQIRFTARPGSRNRVPVVNASDTTLENEHLRVTFDPDGRMTLLDRKTGVALVQSARALVIDDQTDTWGHNTSVYDAVIGEFAGPVEIKTTEQGAVRKTVRVRSRYGNSTLTIDWMLQAGSHALEARVTVDWREKLKLLKLSFPTGLENTTSTTEVAYGFATRPTNGNEEPGQRWIDISGTRPGPGVRAGLALINDAKYGYSTPGGDLRVTVVRSPPYALHRKPDPQFDYHHWMDQGEQTFRLKLVPHDGDWTAVNLPRLAEEFTVPALILLQGIHPGARPQSASFLSIDAASINVTAIKQAEDNDDLVFRCHETAGRATTATLALHFAGKKWTGDFRSHEIKTLRFNRATCTFTETNALEEHEGKTKTEEVK